VVEHWILDGHEVVECADLLKWGQWMEDNHNNRHVADIDIPWFVDDVIRVSTVFLGLDHGFGGTLGPIFFETMVFCNIKGLKLGDQMDRYGTWDEAVAGHNKIVTEVCEKIRLNADEFIEAT